MAKAGRPHIGLGVVPLSTRHGFVVNVSNEPGATVTIHEFRGDVAETGAPERFAAPFTDADYRVELSQDQWQAVASAFWQEANNRLRSNGFAQAKVVKHPVEPVLIHPSLGKELCVLCWAIEDEGLETIPNAIRNWEALAPEERWWLYTMTVGVAGMKKDRGHGWRKALAYALARQSFIPGSEVTARTRRTLLGHAGTQLSMEL